MPLLRVRTPTCSTVTTTSPIRGHRRTRLCDTLEFLREIARRDA
jgi:hypothetical protein